MKAMIIEVCFVESIGDVGLYKKLGHDLIGKTIAQAIVNKNINISDVKPTVNNEIKSNNTDNWIKRLQQECNKQGFSNQVVDGIAGPNTLKGCPLLKNGVSGDITKLLQEKLTSIWYVTNGVDGIFGNGTKNAVIKYQKSKGLSADGIVGQNTWRKLLNI